MSNVAKKVSFQNLPHLANFSKIGQNYLVGDMSKVPKESLENLSFYLIIDQTKMTPSVEPHIRSELSSEKTIHFKDL